MSNIAQISFDKLHDAIKQLPLAENSTKRECLWFDDSKSFGIARDIQGAIELFIFCNKLEPHSKKVQINTDYLKWQFASEDSRYANRIKLPLEEHFEAFAAFLCLHFIEQGIFEKPIESFEKSEPLIALAYEKTFDSIQPVIGCIGELILIRSLLNTSHKSSDIIDSWKGYDKSRRDFQFGSLGVEVKTTTTNHSRHHIQGVHQVEFGVLDKDILENEFYLLSIGIQLTADELPENSFSISDLIESCLSLISAENETKRRKLQATFIEKVENYLNNFGLNYRYGEANNSRRFPQRWQMTFSRAYNMKDKRISLLTSSKLAESPMVIVESVHFEINLPNQVTGNINPIERLNEFVPLITAQI